jgi:hypothetical protein
VVAVVAVVAVVVSAAGCFAVVAGEVWEAEVVEKKVDVKGNGLGLGRTSERWAVRKSAAMFVALLLFCWSDLGASHELDYATGPLS